MLKEALITITLTLSTRQLYGGSQFIGGGERRTRRKETFGDTNGGGDEKPSIEDNGSQ